MSCGAGCLSSSNASLIHDRDRFSRFADEHIAVTHHGKVVGGFVSAAALELLEEIELQRDIQAFDKALKQHQAKGRKTLSHAEMKKRLGIDI